MNATAVVLDFLGICIFHVLNSVQKVTINCKDKRLEIDIKLKLITNVNNILFFSLTCIRYTIHILNTVEYILYEITSHFRSFFVRARLWWTFYDELVSSILFFWFSLETSRIIVVIMGKIHIFSFSRQKIEWWEVSSSRVFPRKKGRKFYCEFVKEKLFLWKYVARTKNEWLL